MRLSPLDYLSGTSEVVILKRRFSLVSTYTTSNKKYHYCSDEEISYSFDQISSTLHLVIFTRYVRRLALFLVTKARQGVSNARALIKQFKSVLNNSLLCDKWPWKYLRDDGGLFYWEFPRGWLIRYLLRLITHRYLPVLSRRRQHIELIIWFFLF